MLEGAEAERTLVAFRRNLVVAASAGTGKTHRLTALYVLLVTGLTSMGACGDDFAEALPPGRVLATTFSRAAAREIARRVEAALVAISDGAPHPFGREIAARIAVSSDVDEEVVRERARVALAQMPDARIDTLHGVARRIVLRHAASLGQPLGAPILDEHDAEVIGHAAVDAAVGEALAAGGDRAAAARALLAATGGVANCRARVMWLCDRVDEEGVAIGDLRLVDHVEAAALVVAKLRVIAAASSRSGAPPCRAPGAALARALEASAFPPGAASSLIELFEARLPQEAKRSAADAALHAFRAEFPGENNAMRAERLAGFLALAPQLVDRERGIRALLVDARARLADKKREAGGLGFGDLLRVARGALLDRPDIAAAEREGAAALLVDEFQDTSASQRDLVYLLRERDRSGRGAGEPPRPEHLEGHGLFLVGDRKQSIYGFRGADVAVFSRTCAELCGADAEAALALAPGGGGEVAAQPIADFVALTTSRRSGGRVLAFINAFSELDFAGDRAGSEAPRAFEIAYGPGEQLAPMPGREGEGRVIFVRDDGRSPEGADALLRGAEGAARQGHVAAAAAAIAIRSGGHAPRDVAVLARRRSTIPFVELALGRLDIPYVVAGRALYDALEVRDASALLRLVVDPRDRHALATVLRGPAVSLSDVELASLSAPGRGLALPRAAAPIVRSNGRLAAFVARLGELRPALLSLPPGEALREALARFELERVVAALPRAEMRLANLDRLVSIARRRGGTLASFSRWLAARIDEETDEAEAAIFSAADDAVRLTTIHASKGLDFPVVVLVDLNAEPRAEAVGLALASGASSTVAERPAGCSTVAERPAARSTVAERPAGWANEGADKRLVVRHFGPRAAWGREGGLGPVQLSTTAAREAQAEARARESAERRRLTYVALTRAATELVLVGDVSTGRGASALRALTAGIDQGALASFVEPIDAVDWLALAPTLPRPPVVRPPAEPPPPARPVLPPARTLTLATTPLAVFAGCARRFQLRHLVGLDEPIARGDLALEDFDLGGEPSLEAGDPRVLGRAVHRLLETWPIGSFGEATDPADVAHALAALGVDVDDADARPVVSAVARFLGSEYAASLRAPGVVARREVPFALELTGEAAAPTIVVRGAIDLLVERPDRAVEIVDYKLSRPSRAAGGAEDLSRHAFQLRTYALAARRGASSVAAAVVHASGASGGRDLAWLGEGDLGSGTLTPLSGASLDAFEAELRALAARLARARHDGAFPPVERPRCAALGCGFVVACHGEAEPEPPPAVAQLTLFG